MLNFFCKILQHPKINPGSAPGKYAHLLFSTLFCQQTLTKFLHLLPQDILKAVRMTVNNSYGRFS